MFPEPVTSIVTLIVVLLACGVGLVVAVRTVVRAVRLRNAPATGLQRAGAPEGADDPTVAARRGQGLIAWMRFSGGGGA